MFGRQFVKVLEKFFTMKNVVMFLLCWIQTSSAMSGYGDLLVNSSLICDTCVNLCETSHQVDDILIGHCQRGCRLFDIFFIQNPMFVKFDMAMAFTKCHNSCYEAYDSHSSAALTACSDGCNNFHKEYVMKRREREQEWEEAERSIFLMLFKPYFQSSEKLASPLVFKVDDFQQVIDSTPHTKRRESASIVQPSSPVHTVERSLKLRNVPTPTASPTAPVTNWITPSSVTIFILGIFVILGLACFCCISNKHPSVNNTTTPKSPVETEPPPPSYEEAICVH